MELGGTRPAKIFENETSFGETLVAETRRNGSGQWRDVILVLGYMR